MGNQKPIAHQIKFQNVGVYKQAFEKSGYGIAFEDDGDTGYLYVTTEKFDHIYDALHLYDAKDGDRLKPGENAFIVWNQTLQKGGIHYHGHFQAVFDFLNQTARCRNSFPPATAEWCKSTHDWQDGMDVGLE